MSSINSKIKPSNPLEIMPSIIVIGASSGLGLEISEFLRNSGYKVISISRRSSNDPNHYSCDVSDFSALKKVYSLLLKKNESIYGLINCAGIASMNLALTTPDSVTNKILSVNLQGTIFSNQIFAPLLIRNGGGRIINFSTIAVHLGLAGESVYVASKAGVEGFTRSFANEMSKFSVTVNCIAPGPIKTSLLKGITDEQIKNIVNRQIIKKLMIPSDVSSLVSILLSDDSVNLTGQVLHLGGV